MARNIPSEIAQEITKHVYADCLKIKAAKQKEDELGIEPYFQKYRWVNWNTSICRLRLTCKTFQYEVDRLFYAEITVKKISNLSMVRLKNALESDSICTAVRTYTFSPNVCLIRPIVESSPWGYYGELRSCCGPEPRLSELEAEHSMRQRVAQHYDEQLRYLGPDTQGLAWMWSGVKRLLLNGAPEPRTSLLCTLLCFSQVNKLKNLQKLHLGYSKPRYKADPWIHYIIKNDISAGLITILKNAPAPLTSITLNFPTLTDLKNICLFAFKEQLHTAQIESISMQIGAESLPHKQAKDKYRHDLHTHATGGTPLADFLALFENLQHVKLSYEDDWGTWGGRLVVPHFHPRAMRSLKSLSIRGFVFNADDLLRITLGEAGAPTLDLKTMDVTRTALFSDGLTWTDVFDAWSSRWPSCNRKSCSLLDKHLEYFDMSTCSRQDLELMDSEFVANLNHAQDEDLTGRKWWR